MLQEAIEKNRGFLRVCAVVAAVTGAAVLIGIMCLAVGVLVGRAMEQDPAKPLQVRDVITLVFSGMAVTLMAMVAFALADFIRWMLNHASRPRWILKHVDKCIYLYVAVRLINSVLAMWTAKISGDSAGQDHIINVLHIVYFVAFQSLWVVPWVLIGIAAGKGVRLMEEYQKSIHLRQGFGGHE